MVCMVSIRFSICMFLYGTLWYIICIIKSIHQSCQYLNLNSRLLIILYLWSLGIIGGNTKAIREEIGFTTNDFGLVLTFGFWYLKLAI